MREGPIAQSQFQPEIKGKAEIEERAIDQYCQLRNRRSEVQAELDCLSVGPEEAQDKVRIKTLRDAVVGIDREIAKLGMGQNRELNLCT